MAILIWLAGMATCAAIFPIIRQIHAFRLTFCATVFIACLACINALMIFTSHIICRMRRTIVRAVNVAIAAVRRVVAYIDALIPACFLIFIFTFQELTTAQRTIHAFSIITCHASVVFALRIIFNQTFALCTAERVVAFWVDTQIAFAWHITANMPIFTFFQAFADGTRLVCRTLDTFAAAIIVIVLDTCTVRIVSLPILI